jgi:hypothetical protein
VDTSDEEDLLGEDTPSNDTDDHDEKEIEAPSPAEAPIHQNSDDARSPEPTPREQLFATSETTSTLRSRNPQLRDEAVDTARTTSSSASAPLTTTETLLTHNRTEQESLTESLLQMAQALKASSHAFAESLDSEKDVLNRAVQGLDKNQIGMEAAQKRMGYLRRMTEGKGWWGRMMMYAWIAALMITAILIVGFLPKLRF